MVTFHHTGHLQQLENNDSEVEKQGAVSEGDILQNHFFFVLNKFLFFRLCVLIYYCGLKIKNVLESQSLFCKEENPFFMLPANRSHLPESMSFHEVFLLKRFQGPLVFLAHNMKMYCIVQLKNTKA